MGAGTFFLFNGTGAVNFFFVLSGFVLCREYFRTGDVNKLKIAVFKRYPRLVGPVLCTTIVSWLLFHFNLYYFYDASRVSGSPWLASFASSGWTPEFHPSLTGALNQGISTFFTGHSSYNSNLWTMKPEFMGSMVIFMISAFIFAIISFENLVVSLVLFSIWGLFFYIHLFPFILGVFLSAYVLKYEIKITFPISITLILIGVYLLGYSIPERDYYWVSYFIDKGFAREDLVTIINSLGSLLLIFAIISNRTIYGVLNKSSFSYLGRLSFPLYLTHTLVICSFSSFMYIFLQDQIFNNNFLLQFLFFSTLVVSIMVSIPFVLFDEIWVKKINYIFKRKFSTR